MDNRYSIRKEYNGETKQVWVIRFCGEYIGWSNEYSSAKKIMADYESKRMAKIC